VRIGRSATWEELLGENPRDSGARRDLRLSLSFLGNVLGVPGFMNLGELDEATAAYRRVLALSRELAGADPRDARARLDLANAYWRLGALVSERNPAEGVPLLGQALDELASLRRAAPDDLDLQRRQGAVRMSLADARRATGESDGALHDMRTAMPVLDDLAARMPGDVGIVGLRRTAHRRLGDLLRERRELAEALASQREALRLAEARAAEHPEDPYARWAVADSYAALGRVQRAIALEGRRPAPSRLEAARAALAWHRQELEVWSGWSALAPSTAFDRTRRTEATRAVAEAEALVARLEGASPMR
jgi:tetratricopeptide (TPR) repeat protein